MFNVDKNGIITLSRGDSFSLNTFINIGTSLNPIQYILQEGDKVYFALCEPHQPFEFALIRREFTSEDLDENGNVVMNFDPEQTEFLLPGTYYYTIKLVRLEESNEIVNTITSKTKFFIID